MLCLPQVERSIKPSLLKSLGPNLGAIKPAYPKNLNLQGSLGLRHPRIIGLLLGLLFGALDRCPGKLCLFLGPQGLIPSPHGNVLGPLCLGQFLLQIDNLLLGNLQLFLSL